MQTKNLIDGIILLDAYRDVKNGFDLGADHDVIYCYATDRPLQLKDIERMLDLGWFQDDGCSEDTGPSAYISEESWWAYV